MNGNILTHLLLAAIPRCDSFMLFIFVSRRQLSSFKAGQETSLQSSGKLNDWSLTLISMVVGFTYKQPHVKKRIHGKGLLKEILQYRQISVQRT